MSIETEIQATTAKLTQLSDQRSRAQGAYDQSMARLKSDFGCDSLTDAEAKATEYETEAKGHEATTRAKMDECKALMAGAQ